MAVADAIRARDPEVFGDSNRKGGEESGYEAGLPKAMSRVSAAWRRNPNFGRQDRISIPLRIASPLDPEKL